MKTFSTLDDKWKQSIIHLLMSNENCRSSLINKKLRNISIPTIRRLLIELQDEGLLVAEIHFDKEIPRVKYMKYHTIIIYGDTVRWKLTNLAKALAA